MLGKKHNHQYQEDDVCVHDEVMKHLQDDKIAMKPRFYFIAGSVLVGVGIAGTILASVFFTHVILYRLRAEQVWGYAGFGAHGLLAFMQFFPWLSLLLAIGGLMGGTYLLKQYDFGCRHRLTRVVIASCALIISFGALLEYLDFGEKMAQFSAVERMYRQQAPVQIVRGTILKIIPRRIVIESPTRGTIFMESSQLGDPSQLSEGDDVQALGRWDRNIFHIQRLRVISVK